MACLHCGKKLPLLKQISNEEFCSEKHRAAYIRQQELMALSRLIKEGPPQRVPEKPAPSEVRNGRAMNWTMLADPPRPVNWDNRLQRPETLTPIVRDSEGILPRLSGSKRPAAFPVCGGAFEDARKRQPGAVAVLVVAESVAPDPVQSLVKEFRSGLRPAPDPEKPPDPIQLAEEGKLAQAGLQLMPHDWVSLNDAGGTTFRRLVDQAEEPCRVEGRPDSYPCAELSLNDWGALGYEGMEAAYRRARPFAVEPRLQVPKAGHGVWQGELPHAAMRPANPEFAAPRSGWLPLAPFSMVRAKNAVAGPLEKVEVMEGHLYTLPPGCRPSVELNLVSALRWARRVPMVVPGAKSMKGCMHTPRETEPVPAFLVPPESSSVSPTHFDPPQYGLQLLRFYPKSGEIHRWRRNVPLHTIQMDPAPVTLTRPDFRPLCDWIPVQTGLFPLPVHIHIRNCRKEPGHPHLVPEIPPPSEPKCPGLPLTATPAPAWSKRCHRLYPFFPDTILPRPHSQTPACELAGQDMVPGRRLPELRLQAIMDGWLLAAERSAGWRGRLQGLASAARNAPALVRWGGAALLAAAITLAVLPGKAGGVQDRVSHASISKSWESVQAHLLKRAAIAMTDDFRSGLSDWEGTGEWARQWSYDAAGFVRTGPLAIYTPSKGMTDYRMELLGQIEKRSIGWTVRSQDPYNYYAVKLTLLNAGPLPEVAIHRYAVLAGKAGPVHTKRLPMQVRMDTVYKILTEVRGSNFVLSVQDQVVDTWTEPNLLSGGVGLFSGPGELARIRWIGVWHQYDTLGRLCAMLAPPGLPGTEREE